MCKQNMATTTGGSGQPAPNSNCTCQRGAAGGCSSRGRFNLAEVAEQPLGMVHHVDPSLIQVGLPGGKGVFDQTHRA